jgi:hypothetical protein
LTSHGSGTNEEEMIPLLVVTSGIEAATGLLLLICPGPVVRLLIGADASGAVGVVARVAGVALVALGVACWPGRRGASVSPRALPAMLTYSSVVTVYLAHLGLGREWAGPLLWPAALLHAVLTALLARCWSRRSRTVSA